MLTAVPAAAKSFNLTNADVEVVVEADGSVRVVEHLTYDFDGLYMGAWRDIPLRAGEDVVDVEVGEAGVSYEPGAPTELGSQGDSGTFGVERRAGFTRVVWHYEAFNEPRTFSISYRMLGLAVAYDDVVDVNLKVWGDQWDQPLGHLYATLELPGVFSSGEVLVWGHPRSVNGSTSLGSDGVSPILTAEGIPSGQWVELRVVFPRSGLQSSDGASVVAGNGLDEILGYEEAQDSQAATDRTLLIFLVSTLALLTFLPATVAVLVIYRRHGREPDVAYDREYEQEPPSNHPPAVIGGLLRQGPVGTEDFVATMFDLIRRGALSAQPVTVEKSTWMGLRREDISDLQIGLADVNRAEGAVEKPVMDILTRVLAEGPLPLTEFRKEIREDAAANASSYDKFESEARKEQVRLGLLDRSGGKPLAWAIGILILIFAFVYLFWRAVVGSRWAPFLTPGLIIAFVINAAIVATFGIRQTGWVKRSDQGALLAVRWQAFKRYLQDFSRLHEAPPIALDLWDAYLVYAITLGVADDVLEAARIQAPEELARSSHLYWYGNHGFSGGHSTNALAGLQSALSGAFAPPGSSGGGGGFSGGGGGGGGGGAW